jgi:hypothetical protein
VDLIIRVTTPGEWKITAVAGSVYDAYNSSGGGKALYITSSATSAEVVEDINRPITPVPTLQIAPMLPPVNTPTPNPD